MTINDGVSFGKVGAFRFWCQKVLPAVYDDSLSYYELLCKVVDYLNRVIDLSNEQSDAINNIQETLNEFLSGEIDPYIDEKVDQWFEENEPSIVAAIDSLEDITSTLEPQIRDGVQVRTTDNVVEWFNNGNKIVANPLYAAVSGEASLTNPLPILYFLNSYRLANDLVYGNDYTATNINLVGTWEPARNHKDSNDKMNIDCTTLVILAAMGVLYNASTYTDNGSNIGTSYFIDMFNDVTEKYITYEVDYLDIPVEIEHYRLLSGEFAKLLYDRGLLTKIYNPNKNVPDSTIPLGALKGQLAIGDVIFHSNTSGEHHWDNIGHCSIVVGETDDNIIICDATTGRGSTPVRYSILHDYNQIHWKWTPQSVVWPTTGHGGYYAYFSGQSASYQQSFSNPGYAVVYNSLAAVDLTLGITFPNISSRQDTIINLGQNQTYVIIVPGGCTLDIENPAETTLSIKYAITPYGINPEPYK